MRKKKKVVGPLSHFYETKDSIELPTGKVINNGDIIKIKGEYGTKFRFIGHTVNKRTGATWIDCFELERGQVRAWRSFKEDRIKPIHIPKKRRKKTA